MSEQPRCGYAVVDADGIQQPCDRPAPFWRWYQDVEHEDTLDVACELHENEGGRRMMALQVKVNELLTKIGATRDLADRWLYAGNGFSAREVLAALDAESAS